MQRGDSAVGGGKRDVVQQAPCADCGARAPRRAAWRRARTRRLRRRLYSARSDSLAANDVLRLGGGGVTVARAEARAEQPREEGADVAQSPGDVPVERDREMSTPGSTSRRRGARH